MLKQATAVLTIGVLAFSLAGSARAEKSNAEAVVKKAIAASGGEENLTKHKVWSWKQKGKFYGMGDGFDYSATYTWAPPDKLRLEVEGAFTQVVNGDKGWNNMGGSDATELNAQQMEEQKETLHLRRLTASLVPLLKDKTLKITPVADAKVDDHAAAGIKVSSTGHRDVTLYFDKDTGLLVKSETTAKTEDGNVVPQETRYSDYKEFDGVKIPTKLTAKRDGKPFIEGENSDVKFSDTVDDKTFQKP